MFTTQQETQAWASVSLSATSAPEINPVLAAVVSSNVGANEEHAVVSLLWQAGTYEMVGEFVGMNDFEEAELVTVLAEDVP